MLQCIEAMHDTASGSLPPQLQVDVDVFTVSVLESCHWGRHLVATDPRVHHVEGVAVVKHAATAAVAAMCRSSLRRMGEVWLCAPDAAYCAHYMHASRGSFPFPLVRSCVMWARISLDCVHGSGLCMLVSAVLLCAHA